MHEKNKRVIGCNSQHLFMMVKKTCSRRNILKKLRTRSDFAKIVNDTISTDFNRYDKHCLAFGRNHSRRTGYCAKSPGACPGPFSTSFINLK